MRNLLAFIIAIGLFASSAKAQSDTIAIFKAVNLKADKFLSFDDNNTLSIKQIGAKLVCKEEKGDSYTLTVSIKNKIILTKPHIKGITKVLSEGAYLMFSIFTYSDEDGNNQGYAYVINISNNAVKIFPRKLKNTCNPVVVGDAVYIVSSSRLFKTDIDLNLKRIIFVAYLNKDKTYLDSYFINGLMQTGNKNLLIDFAANRFSGKSKLYSGTVIDSTRVVILK